jgi:RNA polymerase-binding transcription factor DksA
MMDELTPQVLAELRVLLERKREHLKGKHATERTRESADNTATSDQSIEILGDLGEVSVDRYAWDGAHQELLDGEEQLAEVVRALTKLGRGTYGDCERCGRPIPLARLHVLPEARYDVVHEAQMEDSRQSSSS